MSADRWYSDEDVERIDALIVWHEETAQAILDLLTPRVAEARRAAKVEALREFAQVFVLDNPGMATNLYRRADEIERGEQ